MGKVLTIDKESVKIEIDGKGVFERTFLQFLLDAMDAKGPVDSLSSIDTAIQVVRKIKDARKDDAATITFEDEEFKVLAAATKGFLPTLVPVVSRDYRRFYASLEDKAVQTVDLATKK